jgi:hypothetical protein
VSDARHAIGGLRVGGLGDRIRDQTNVMRARGDFSLSPSHAILFNQILRWDSMPFSVLELRRKSTKFWIDDVNRVGQKNRGGSTIAMTTSLQTRVKLFMASFASTTMDFNTEKISE